MSPGPYGWGYPTHCASCHQPLAYPVQETAEGVMHAACAVRWRGRDHALWGWLGAGVLFACATVAYIVGGILLD